ncbi:unnamed protein product, partial [Meganyctiphanes norvegica]
MGSNNEPGDLHFSQHLLINIVKEDIDMKFKEEIEVYEAPVLSQDVKMYIKEELECNPYDKAFPRKCRHKECQRKHTGEKPYQCNKRMKHTHTNSLIGHQSVDSGRKP